jgi:hypothetical protein
MDMGAFQFQGHWDMTQGTISQQQQPQGMPDTIGHSSITPEAELEAAEDKRRRNTGASGKTCQINPTGKHSSNISSKHASGLRRNTKQSLWSGP